MQSGGGGGGGGRTGIENRWITRRGRHYMIYSAMKRFLADLFIFLAAYLSHLKYSDHHTFFSYYTKIMQVNTKKKLRE